MIQIQSLVIDISAHNPSHNNTFYKIVSPLYTINYNYLHYKLPYAMNCTNFLKQ